MGGVQIDRQHAVDDAAALVARDRARGRAAGEAAGQDLAHEGDAAALVIAKRPQRPGAVAGIAHMRALQRAVKLGRVAREAAIRSHQRIRRDRLAAIAGHQHLALGHHRGSEVQQQRRPIRLRHPDGERIGAEPPLDAAERRHDLAHADIDEMDRDQPGGRRPLRPVADPADMPGIAQRHHREAPPPAPWRCRDRPPAARWSGQARHCRRPRHASRSRRRR